MQQLLQNSFQHVQQVVHAKKQALRANEKRAAARKMWQFALQEVRKIVRANKVCASDGACASKRPKLT